MIFDLFWSLLMPIAFWFLFFYYYFEGDNNRANLLVIFCLALGISFGTSSILFFLWLVIFGPKIVGLLIVESVLLIGLLVIVSVRKGFPGKLIFVSKNVFKAVSEKRLSKVISVCFFAVLIADILGFLYKSLNNPHGAWDAWAIWNLRARFLFRAGEQWAIAFSPSLSYSHTDYPLLTPAFITQCWKFVGNDTTIIPILVAMFFTFGTIGLTVGCISDLRDKNQGYLAGIVLLGTVPFVNMGVSQYADMPITFYFLATIIILTLKDGLAINNPSWLVMAGITAGLAAWTKNEGLLSFVVIIVTRIIIVVKNDGWRAYIKEFFYFSIGLLPILMMVIYFKIQFAPPNDLIAGQGYHQTFERILTFPRYAYILKSYLMEIILLGERNFDAPMVILLIVYLFFMGFDKESKYRLHIFTSLIFVSLMLSGYFIIYLVSPHDLVWHITSSMRRLILQLYPCILISYFLIVRSTEEVVHDDM